MQLKSRISLVLILFLKDHLNFFARLVLQQLLQHPLNLNQVDRRSDSQDLHGSSFLDKLAFDSQSFLRHFLSAIIADLLVPGLISSFLQVPLYLDSPDTLDLLLVSHQQ